MDANNTLIIKNAKEQDSGAYTCTINLGPGQAPEVIYKVIIHSTSSGEYNFQLKPIKMFEIMCQIIVF